MKREIISVTGWVIGLLIIAIIWLVIAIIWLAWSNTSTDKLGTRSECISQVAKNNGFAGTPYEEWQLFSEYCKANNK